MIGVLRRYSSRLVSLALIIALAAPHAPSLALPPADRPGQNVLVQDATPTPAYAPFGVLMGWLLADIPYEAEFFSPFDRHILRFSGEAGRYLTLVFETVGVSAVDPRLTLYDARGRALATDDDSGGGVNAAIRGVRLPEDGEYFVQLVGGAAGSYRLSLTFADDLSSLIAPVGDPSYATAAPVQARGARLPDSEPVAASVRPGGLFMRYFISAEAGDVLTIEARTAEGSPLRLALELYTPAGELMSRVGAGATGAVIPGIGVIETGWYPLFVVDDGDRGGAFTLVWRYEHRATPLTPGLPRVLTALDSVPARDALHYPFYGEAGMRVRVTVEAVSAGLDPVAALLGPSGKVVADGDDSADSLNPVFEVVLPSDGTYILRVNAYGERGGDARVVVERLP